MLGGTASLRWATPVVRRPTHSTRTRRHQSPPRHPALPHHHSSRPLRQHSPTMPKQRRLRSHPRAPHASTTIRHHALRPALPHRAQPTPVAPPPTHSPHLHRHIRTPRPLPPFIATHTPRSPPPPFIAIHALPTPPPPFAATHAPPTPPPPFAATHALPHTSTTIRRHTLRPALPHHAQPTPVARPSGVTI